MLPASLLAVLLIAQDKPADKCTLSGTVTDSVTGAPLNKVQILMESLGNARNPLAVANSDGKGNFSMVELDPGKYRVKAVRNGYLDTYYGARRGDSQGITVTLEAGQEIKDLQVKLLPYAVIGGTIRDPEGEPVAGARVLVQRLIYRDGQRVLEGADEIATDDLGQYRAVNLTPGKYYVEAQPRGVFEFGDAPVDHSSKASQPVEILLTALYPGVGDRAAAKAVEVTAGARVSGIDVALPRGRLYSVSGHLPAEATANIQIDRPGSSFGDRAAWASGVKGDFEIRGLPPGSYLLHAGAQSPADHSSAEIPLTVDNADVTGLKVTLEPNPELTGQITILGERPISLGGGYIKFGAYSVDIHDDNSFASSMTPGHYVVAVAGDQLEKDLVIKSIQMGQTDLLRDQLTLAPGASARLEIVLAPDGGQIEGTAFDRNDNPAPGATVVAIPEAGLRMRPDRFYQAATDQHGHYDLKNVAPGDYKIFAWENIEPGAWFDPDFLRDIESHGEPVKLSAKGHETVKVHLTIDK